MKKSVLTFIAIILAVITLHAFRIMQQPTITGKIVPWNAATQVWAVNGSSLLKVEPSNGEFRFAAHPGSWKVMVRANAPYRDLRMPAEVTAGKTLNLGEIKLQQ